MVLAICLATTEVNSILWKACVNWHHSCLIVYDIFKNDQVMSIFMWLWTETCEHYSTNSYFTQYNIDCEMYV